MLKHENDVSNIIGQDTLEERIATEKANRERAIETGNR